MSTRSNLQFATWLRKTHPKIYRRAKLHADTAINGGDKVIDIRSGAPIQKSKPMISLPPKGGVSTPLWGLGEDTAAKQSWWDKFLQGATGAATAYMTLKNQRDQMKLNLQRANQGLPPLDIAASGPVIRTEVDVPPDVVDKVTASVGGNINKMLLFGGVAIAAFLLLSNRKRA